MRVVSYLAGIPSLHKNPQKAEMLRRFAQGVRQCGDHGIEHEVRRLLEADVGVIQGWVHAGSPKTPHLTLRRKVSENVHNKHTVIIDSNLFKYTGRELNYYRFSLDGIFPSTGNYFNNQVDPNRWKQISQDYNISLKDWQQRGNNILICLQRNGGWSMDGLDVTDWLVQTVKRIRKATDKPIIVRPHPGDKKSSQYLPPVAQQLGIEISHAPSLLDDFSKAWAVVTYNSSPGVAAAIEGIPVFVTDPSPHRSQAFPVANTVLSKIENPDLVDRQSWIEGICMSHWNFEELSNGTAWKHIRRYCQ